MYDRALLESPASLRSLGQEYRIYSDRIELPFHMSLGRTITVPLADVIDIWVARPVVVGEMFRIRGFRAGMALKLDLADLYKHVGLQRGTGWFHHIHFTPRDPERFVSLCRELIRHVR